MKRILFFILALNFFVISYAENAANADEQPTIIPPYSVTEYDQTFAKFYADHPVSQSANVLDRLNADSGFFLGKPYMLGALGEGPDAEFDKSPLYRPDAFDCMTYVSTVLAMVESTDVNQFRQLLLNIRYYNEKPSYLTRNHFTSTEWDTHNNTHKYVTDITEKLFPKQHLTAVAVINKPEWFAHAKASSIKQFNALTPAETQVLLEKMHTLSKQTTLDISNLPYVPLTALFDKNGAPIMQQFDKIPSGVIIEIVRPNWDLTKQIGTHINISHLGFGIRINNVLMYREASSIDDKVEDVPLAQYLETYLKSPTVKGINIQLINLVSTNLN